MSFRNLVFWLAVMGALGQMLRSCESFSMICQWSRTDLEICLPSDESGVTTGGIDLELRALGVL